MASKPMRIVVVGGSLGGLFTGIVLKRLGHSVTILERTPSALLHNQGAGIVAGGAVQDFFATFDRTKTPIAVTSHVRQYLNKKGEIIDRENSVQKMTSWDLLYNILRANFDGMVEDGYCTIPEDQSIDSKAEYLYGYKVLEVTPNSQSGVSVGFQDKDGIEGSLEADLVFAADGPSSTIRGLLLPEVKRTYAGYVAWRGTVLESEVSEKTLECFKDKFVFFHSKGTQILAYLIPGRKGTLEPGKRLINYVWYCNYASGSSELTDLMTDADGQQHRFTLPAGKMQQNIWQRQKEHASQILPPQFAELVQRTETPFIQAVTDVLSPSSLLMDEKVVLVGDALAGFRPHTAGSTGQAAWHAILLENVELFGDGEKKLREWQEEVMEWAKHRGNQGIEMGQRSQFGKHPLADWSQFGNHS